MATMGPWATMGRRGAASAKASTATVGFNLGLANLARQATVGRQGALNANAIRAIMGRRRGLSAKKI